MCCHTRIFRPLPLGREALVGVRVIGSLKLSKTRPREKLSYERWFGVFYLHVLTILTRKSRFISAWMIFPRTVLSGVQWHRVVKNGRVITNHFPISTHKVSPKEYLALGSLEFQRLKRNTEILLSKSITQPACKHHLRRLEAGIVVRPVRTAEQQHRRKHFERKRNQNFSDSPAEYWRLLFRKGPTLRGVIVAWSPQRGCRRYKKSSHRTPLHVAPPVSPWIEESQPQGDLTASSNALARAPWRARRYMAANTDSRFVSFCACKTTWVLGRCLSSKFTFSF